MEDYKTGDLLLFDFENYYGLGFFSFLVKFVTKSKYSHIGMILKDPDFLDTPLKGYYLKGVQNFNEDISGWDTTKVTDLSNMFYGDIIIGLYAKNFNP